MSKLKLEEVKELSYSVVNLCAGKPADICVVSLLEAVVIIIKQQQIDLSTVDAISQIEKILADIKIAEAMNVRN